MGVLAKCHLTISYSLKIQKAGYAHVSHVLSYKLAKGLASNLIVIINSKSRQNMFGFASVYGGQKPFEKYLGKVSNSVVKRSICNFRPYGNT